MKIGKKESGVSIVIFAFDHNTVQDAGKNAHGIAHGIHSFTVKQRTLGKLNGLSIGARYLKYCKIRVSRTCKDSGSRKDLADTVSDIQPFCFSDNMLIGHNDVLTDKEAGAASSGAFNLHHRRNTLLKNGCCRCYLCNGDGLAQIGGRIKTHIHIDCKG